MNLVYLYLLSPLHTGGTTQEGNLLGIARESHTDLPYVPSSTIRGRLRASVEDKTQKFALFGNEIEDGQTLKQGAIWIGDASILWLPVPSLSHGVVWVSCPLLLRRWLRLSGNPDRLVVPDGYETSLPTDSPVYLKDAILPATDLIRWTDWDKFTTNHPETEGIKNVLVLPVNYQERLKALNQRTEKISKARRGVHFKVMCPWRMRVGGHRGPESILLPSFDALGVPYLPSSTLTGVARAAAIREFMERDNLSWQNAEKKIAAYFGSIEATDSKNRAGKVVFLDAYPESSKSAGLAMDMANSIWRWEGDRIGDYSPNPNSFFSLKDVTFVIGVCRMSNCDDDTFIQVKEWLIKGLQSGIGSQINSGYGSMGVENEPSTHQPFLKLDFDIEGQLIHANKRFKDIKQPYRFDKGRLRDNLISEPEARSVSFKSMLRYWFRSFSLGVLPSMGEQGVKAWEAKLFGSIDPAAWGWVKFDLVAGKQYEPSQKEAGLQQGILRLYFSPSAPIDKQDHLKSLFKNLTWLMFRLGGVGQGARRPCHKRKSNPWYRGSKLVPYGNDDSFWDLPDMPEKFHQQFQERLQGFYKALSNITGRLISYKNINYVGEVTSNQWVEAVDGNCIIFAFQGDNRQSKKHALAVLHSQEFKKNGGYDIDLCGEATRNNVQPSPVWIADAEDENYQVVTVFGATQEPRKEFVKKLLDQGAIQVFPII